MTFTFYNFGDLNTDNSCAELSGDISYDWGLLSPGTCDADNFAGLGSGSFISPVTGPIQFCGAMDDRLRVIVDDTYVFEALGSACGSIDLQEGHCYRLYVAFNELTGNASMNLTWEWSGSPPDTVRAESIIDRCPTQPIIDSAGFLNRTRTESDLPNTR